MKEKTCGRLIHAVFACVFLCMLIFNFLTPMISDDFAHYYGVSGEHISSLGEIFENLGELRRETNGRVIAHFFVYLFQIPPKAVFNVVNAAVSAAVLMLLFRYIRNGSSRDSLLLLVTAVFMLWYFMPGFGQIFLWLTGSCNYSWGLAADLALLFPFFREFTSGSGAESESARGGILRKIIYILLAVFAGAYSENGASATIFAAGLFTLLIWIRNKKFPAFYFVLCLAACAGFAFLMLAPSELGGRTGDLSSGGIFDSAKNCLLLTKKYCLGLWCIYFALLGLSLACGAEKRMAAASAVLVCAGAVSVAVFAFAAYLPARSFFIMVTFTVLACLLLLREVMKTPLRPFAAAFAGVMAALFLFSFILGAGDIFSLKLQEKTRKEQIALSLAEGETDITLKAYAASTMYPAAFDEELTEEPDGWYNGLLARYYGLSSVSGTGINYYFD